MGVIEASGIRDQEDWPLAFPKAFDESSALGPAISEVLKGVEWALPDGNAFRDKDGNQRHEARVTWWAVASGDRFHQRGREAVIPVTKWPRWTVRAHRAHTPSIRIF